MQAFAEKEEAHLKALRDLAPRYHVRPSLLAPAASAAGFALGALSSVLPSRLSAAVSGALPFLEPVCLCVRSCREPCSIPSTLTTKPPSPHP